MANSSRFLVTTALAEIKKVRLWKRQFLNIAFKAASRAFFERQGMQHMTFDELTLLLAAAFECGRVELMVGRIMATPPGR